MDDLSGQEIRGYKLIERIGEGGFGVVYRAEQPSIDREVAIKVILPDFADHPEFVRRFEAEARMVAKLEHPHIVPLYDYWRGKEGAFLVMRWLRGGSLREALKRGPWDVEAVGHLLEHIADALSLAHEQCVIHRDLKPENILLDEAGNAYLTDFGIAKDLGGEGLTQTGKIVGSVDYLAPEQAKGEEVTPRTDIYGLGVVLYEMLTGEHPFPGLTPVQMLQKHLNQSLPSIRVSRPELPEALDQVVQRATAKDPGERYSDAIEMVEAYKHALALVEDTVVELGVPAFLEEVEGERDVQRPIFVGRLRELTFLEGFLEKALSGQGQVVFITGGSGRGKTALVEEFSRRAQEKFPDLVVALGNCNAHTGVGDPYLPFRQILEMLTGDVVTRLETGMISRDHAQRLWETLPHTAQALMESGPDLIDTFVAGAPLASRVVAYTRPETEWSKALGRIIKSRVTYGPSSETKQTDLFEQFSRVLLAISRHRPILLLLDDLQWADNGSINLLFHLGRLAAQGYILIVGAYRPEEVTLGRDGKRHPLESVVNELIRKYGDITVNLTQVEEDEVRGFVESFLDTEPNLLTIEFRQALYEHTGGHPLFTIELLRSMQGRGDIVEDEDGRWIEGSQLRWDELPARVEAVIEERIGRLEDRFREILSVASVEGEDFTAQVIARVQEIKERQLIRELSLELEKRHRLVREQGELKINGKLLSRYRFAHHLFQRYLYNNLAAGERRLLHGEIASAIEELFAEDIEGVTTQLAFHYQQAENTEKALQYLKQAGNQAKIRFANEEAIQLFTQALELLPEDHSDRFGLLASRTEIYDVIANRDKQCADIDAMLELAEEFDDDALRCDALIAQADYYLSTQHIHALEPSERAVELALKMKDLVREGHARQQLGKAASAKDDLPRSRIELERAIECFQQTDSISEASTSWANLSLTLGALNEFKAALEAAEKSVTLARETGDQRQEAINLRRVAIAHMNRNDHIQALPIVKQALSLHKELGDRLQECYALNVLGIIQRQLGDSVDAKTAFCQSLEIAEAIGSSIGTFQAVGGLFFTYYQHGLLQDCLALFESQLEKATEIEDEWLIGEFQWNKTMRLIELGQYELASEFIEYTLQTMEKFGTSHQKIWTYSLKGFLQALTNDYTSARETLKYALLQADEIGDDNLLCIVYLFQAFIAMLEKDPKRSHIGLNHAFRGLEISPEEGHWYRGIMMDIVASLHHSLDETIKAVEFSTRSIQLMEFDPIPWLPERRFFTHFRILRDLGREQEADDYLRRAYERVMLVANNTKDEELRRSWLENVRVNREILEVCTECGIGG